MLFKLYDRLRISIGDLTLIKFGVGNRRERTQTHGEQIEEKEHGRVVRVEKEKVNQGLRTIDRCLVGDAPDDKEEWIKFVEAKDQG